MKPMKLERLAVLRWLVPLALALLLIASCQSLDSPQAGSETHFLRPCEGSCDNGLECICGVCSRACLGERHCAELPFASCTALGPRVAERRCDDTPFDAICDVGCLVDADCGALSAASRCDNGYCREEPQTPVERPANSCLPSNVAPDDVLILGDVLIELSIFTEQLEQAAVAAGSLATGQHYRNSAAALTSLLASGPSSIESQYTSAVADGGPRVVIMDGGATDVLNDNCADQLTPDCPAARAAVTGAEQLFARFAEDGVEHVVYFFYGDPVDNPSLKDGLDLLRPLLENACGRSPVPCHWLDLRPIFAEHEEYVGVDGLVFTDAGATAAAAATFELMQRRCVAN
jgi:hypothetical protein